MKMNCAINKIIPQMNARLFCCAIAVVVLLGGISLKESDAGGKIIDQQTYRRVTK
ncbi:MAG: hypothetical protein NUV76_12880 [Candidatus Kuenenia sp.]|nr:hypothetical protein [Candidatus Kuenenia sp.]